MDDADLPRVLLAMYELLVQTTKDRKNAVGIARLAFEEYGHFIPLPEPELKEEEAMRCSGQYLMHIKKWGDPQYKLDEEVRHAKFVNRVLTKGRI
jgi:hypothetical protein